jgi:hypothetical protein
LPGKGLKNPGGVSFFEYNARFQLIGLALAMLKGWIFLTFSHAQNGVAN